MSIINLEECIRFEECKIIKLGDTECDGEGNIDHHGEIISCHGYHAINEPFECRGCGYYASHKYEGVQKNLEGNFAFHTYTCINKKCGTTGALRK